MGVRIEQPPSLHKSLASVSEVVPSGTARVVELAKPGKANTWNQFVHKLSSTKASILFMMDADITFLSSNTISRCLSVYKIFLKR